MTGLTDLPTLLRELRPSVRDGDFVYVTSPEPIAAEARIVEREAVTLVLRREVADDHGLTHVGTYGWITLEVHSSLEAVGLTAAVSTALAEAGLSCNLLAGFYHDHLLVPSAQVGRALAVLAALSRDAGNEHHDDTNRLGHP